MAWLRSIALLSLVSSVRGNRVELLSKDYEGAVTGEFESTHGNLDGAKLQPYANDTSFDWWYFDAVSASSDANVVFGFYNAGPGGLGWFTESNLWFQIQGNFANGTSFGNSFIAATDAIITNDVIGLSAEWIGSGASLRATSLDSELITYTTTIDIPSLGVYGTVTLHSVAPPHYPCGLNVAGVSEEMLPNVGWANAVPDAYASVDLVINGTKLQFSDGIGYHDKNWGTAPLADNLETWYWGHARVGPYSIVWFDATPPNGAERFSAYVAKNGIVAQASCANKSVFVRPWGANSTYPPLPSTGPMQGIEVTFDLGNGETLAANVTTGAFVASDGDYYVRTLGSLSATIKSPGRDDEVFHCGRALYEEFKFGPSQK
ncbi:hypothetical protein J3E68DRAFT_447531 [Trichoderma sp. SZMC 28012]